MKQLKFLAIAATALLAAATLSFTSCSSDDDPVDDTTFSVSPTSLAFDAAGGTKTLTVTGDWDKNPTTEATWLTLTTTDTKITVVAEAYTETTARTATITVGDKTVNVSQAAYVAPTPSITVSPSSLTFNASGNSAQTVSVTLSNIEGSWTATASQTWVTVTASDNTFTVNVSDNDGSARTATVTVKADADATVTATVSVSQKGVGSSTGAIFNGTYTASWDSLFSTYNGLDWGTASSFSGSMGTDTSQDYDILSDGTAWTMTSITNFDGIGDDFAIWVAYNSDNGWIVPSIGINTLTDGTTEYTAYTMFVNSTGYISGSDDTIEGYDGANTFSFVNTYDSSYPYVAVIIADSTTAYFYSDGFNNLKLNYSETRSGVANNSVAGFSYDSKLSLKGQPVKNFKPNVR